MIKFLKADSTFRFALILSFTLGLAPFLPEPHLWGKIKWLIGGGVGMSIADYFDFVFHGSPWVLLVASFVAKKVRK